jgi:hypothetical protein
MPNVDDHRIGAATPREKVRDFFNRLLRGGKSDPHRRFVSQSLEAFERQRQMRSALVICDGVDLINDYRFNVAEDRTALIRRQQNVKRLRCGHQDMRRPLQHSSTLVHQCVASANRRANLRHQETTLACHRQDFSQRSFKIFLDVIAQRLERRDVQNFGAVGKISGQSFAHQTVDAGKKCSQRLAGARWRGYQRGATGENVRPALLLRLGWRGESPDKPLSYKGMGPGEGRREGRHPMIVAGRGAFVNCSLSTAWFSPAGC